MTLDWCFHLHKIRHTETGYGLYRWFTLFTLMLFTLLGFGETAVSSEFADAEVRGRKMVQLPTLILGRKGTGMLVFWRVPIFVCVHAHVSPARRLSLSHACILLCSVV